MRFLGSTDRDCMRFIVSYGDDQYDDRTELRSVVWEIANGRCEWCVLLGGPDAMAVELAHIVSRGMGGSKARDTVNNSFAACTLHARASDFQGRAAADEWMRLVGSPTYEPDRLRAALIELRQSQGWAV